MQGATIRNSEQWDTVDVKRRCKAIEERVIRLDGDYDRQAVLLHGLREDVQSRFPRQVQYGLIPLEYIRHRA